MDITVIGPGALGCLVAASIAVKPKLSDQEKDSRRLWLLDHNPERAALLAQKGLILEEDGRRLQCPIKATADPTDIGAW